MASGRLSDVNNGGRVHALFGPPCVLESTVAGAETRLFFRFRRISPGWRVSGPLDWPLPALPGRGELRPALSDVTMMRRAHALFGPPCVLESAVAGAETRLFFRFRRISPGWRVSGPLDWPLPALPGQGSGASTCVKASLSVPAPGALRMGGRRCALGVAAAANQWAQNGYA